jgi:predicted nucleic acid-binding protein
LNADFIIADASVLLKWYLHHNEPYRAQALLLFDRFRSGEVRILLPELALYELGNRLIRLSGSGWQLFADAADLLTDVVLFEPGDLKLIARFAASLHKRGLKKITMYDCAYIHLAKATDSPLLTADCLQAAAARSLMTQSILIEDYV